MRNNQLDSLSHSLTHISLETDKQHCTKNETEDLVTFAEKILNGKLLFLGNVNDKRIIIVIIMLMIKSVIVITMIAITPPLYLWENIRTRGQLD